MEGPTRTSYGFSLLELLIALVLLSILLLTSVPIFSDLISRNNITSTKLELKKAIKLARSEAILQGQTVYFCFTPDEIRCNGDQGGSLMVFTDPNYQSGRSSESRTLYEYSWPSEALQVSYNRSLLKFSARGHAMGTNGTLTICDREGLRKDGLVISTLGRVRQAEDYDGDGVKEKSPSTPLVCS